MMKKINTSYRQKTVRFSVAGAMVALMLCFVAKPLQAETYNFNVEWRFIKENPQGAEVIGFDDSSWQTVSAPHTYNDVDTFDDMSPGGHIGEMNQWGGKTWYRKHFIAPAEWKSKVVIMEFEAVRQVADVFCNGVRVGRCENGFLPFAADLTKHLKFGQTNVIAVLCDNRFKKDSGKGDSKNSGPDDGISAQLPWNNPHWHPAHGGLYRNVFLHVSEKLYFTQPLFNNLETVGTYVYAIKPSRKDTGIGIEAEIANATGESQKFVLRSKVLDHEGKVVLEMKTDAEVPVGEKAVVKNTGTLKSPKLWEPKYPYLYSIINEIVKDGQVIDSNQIPFGIRWAQFTKDSGFFINDRYTKLQGWGQKSMDGWPGLGAANSDWMHYYTLRMITDCGGNFIRWGHTAGGPGQIRSADQLGIISLQPGVDGEGDVGGEAWKIRAAAWRDGVIYYRNNPSIIIWEGGNQSVSKSHVEELSDIVKKYDPYGGRVYAHRRADATVEPYCDITISTEGSGFRAALPTVEGEYNREESPRRVWDRKTPPYQNWHAKGSYDLTSEAFAIGQLYNYDKIARQSHCGGANWIFTDSTSGGRLTTEVTRASGEVDAMRLPKEAYYVCRVIFTDEPDIHLIGHWNYPEGTVKDIHVAGDCDEVRLSLNGKEIGHQKSGASASDKRKSQENVKPHRMLFTFPSVTWESGKLVAVGYVNGKEIDRDERVTAGPAVHLKLSALTGPTGLLADGSDAVVIDVEAIDKNGNRCPTFEQRVDFNTAGPGVWRGGYNSGIAKSTNNKYLNLECGINRVIVRSTTKACDITVTAETKGLPAASIVIASKPVPFKQGLAMYMPPLPKQGVLAALPLPTGAAKDVVSANDVSSETRSELFGDVSYSGPSGKITIQKIKVGAHLYSDQTQALPSCPDFLQKGEFIALPSSDWNYSAVDLLQFESLTDATIYIAHDATLKKMEWLQKNFKDTGQTLSDGKNRWQLFRKAVKKGESLLLGSNTEIKEGKGQMMVVFSVPKE